jgi:predicted TIM-barrel fold metal-dependent hydrolase
MADNDPYLIIAADSHAGLPTAQYRDYLERRFYPQFDEFLSERAAFVEAATNLGVRDDQFARQWFEEHDEELAGGWDAIKRDQALDNDGVAAEVVYPDADAVESRTCVPFGAGLGLSGDLDPELGMAGAKAHNRWLAELCSTSPERRCGVALVPITVEIDDVLAEIHHAKESGLGAVMIPAMWVNEAPYHDRRYDPVWALCEELQMPVVTHSGSASRDEYGDHLGIYVTEVTWWPARPMWFLLWSGVFKRFPGLRFGVTEGGCWWLPGLLWSWDLAAHPNLARESSQRHSVTCSPARSSTGTASPASPMRSDASSACDTRSASTTCSGDQTFRIRKVHGRTLMSG